MLKARGIVHLISLALIAIRAGTCQPACDLLPPMEEKGGPEFGVVLVPGDTLKGETYQPLSVALQTRFPGRLWVGLTTGYLGDAPNQLQAETAIQQCFDSAQTAGYSLDTIFVTGHSHGGAIVEELVRGDLRPNYAGVILFGSYITNNVANGETNDYPIPLLTAVGTLDGRATSYAVREWRESRVSPASDDLPVILVEDCTHLQVSSGEMSPNVLENDIDPIISQEEAHARYAEAAVSFMVTTRTARDLFSEDVINQETSVISGLAAYTEEFVEPFNRLQGLEDRNGEQSPWLNYAQRILLHGDDSGIDLSELTVFDNLVPMDDLGETKPEISVLGGDCRNVTVSTFNTNLFDFDPIDNGKLVSAGTMKAKLKLSDEVLVALCQGERPRRQCKDINAAALDLALSLTAEGTLERYFSKGRQLVIGNDTETWWGPGWLESPGMEYTMIDEMTVQIGGTSLETEPTGTIVGGMLYCDLLSPYRAIEYVYIQSVLNGNPFQ